jgi:hypothetical protein
MAFDNGLTDKKRGYLAKTNSLFQLFLRLFNHTLYEIALSLNHSSLLR